jgi:Mg2+ and Co2+ transporter CorA
MHHHGKEIEKTTFSAFWIKVTRPETAEMQEMIKTLWGIEHE